LNSEDRQVRVATSALIINDQKILLVKKAREPNKGLWSLPGGLVELGETIEEALVREVNEETGLSIRPTGVAAITQLIQREKQATQPYHYIIVTMTATLVGGTPKPGGDAEAMEWVPLKEVHKRKLAQGVDAVLSTLGLTG
jgi:8-oxo-dGTP diphosphatase